MFTAFNAFITTLFTGLNSLALAFCSMCNVARDSAGAFEDEATINREANRHTLNKQLKITTTE